MFDYNECALFAAALFKDADRSWTKVNAAFDRPPSTTEQVMHPEKYLLGETPTSMKTLNIEKRLPGGWKQKDSSILGEFDLYNYLFSVGGDKDPAAKAAAGWGVGWVNIYDNAKTSDVLLHIQLEFDSAAELGQFVEYYRTVANKVAGKDVSSAAASGPICWNNDAEYGYFTYADGLPRADIVISTNQAARDAAAHGSLSAVTRGACTAT